jgi:putative hydrolase of the HAD superfamily
MRATLVFDLGGVVLRWEPAELLRERLPQRLPDLASAQRLAGAFFESFRPGSDWAEFDRGRYDDTEVARRLAQRLALPLAEVQSVIDGIPDHLQLRADTVALLRELHAAGHRLVYLSNMPRPFRPTALKALEALAVFDTGLFSCDLGLVKPEPEIYLAAMQHFGMPAVDCRFFDDSESNVLAARRAGWQAWRFSDAAVARADLVDIGLAGLLPNVSAA